MSKNTIHYAIIGRTLKKHSITWPQYKNDPLLLVKKDEPFRKWFLEHFKDKEDTFKWYGKTMNLNSINAALRADNRFNNKRPEFDKNYKKDVQAFGNARKGQSIICMVFIYINY